MGDIFRKIDVCGLDVRGRKLRCSRVDALVDPGSTTTVISEKLATAIGGPYLEGMEATIEGRKVPVKLTGLTLDSPGCKIRALTVSVSNEIVARAGRAPNGHLADVILGHDYLQRSYAQIAYGERTKDHSVRCRNGKKARRK